MMRLPAPVTVESVTDTAGAVSALTVVPLNVRSVWLAASVNV
jgi:hypothetical protein